MLFLSSFWTIGPLYFLSWCYLFPLFELLLLSFFWIVGLLFFISWCYSSPLSVSYWSSLLSELVLFLSFLWTIVVHLLSLSYYCSSPLCELTVLLFSFMKCWCSFPLFKMFLSPSLVPFFSSTTDGSPSFLFQLLLLVFPPLSMHFFPFFYLLRLFYLDY